MVSPLNVHLNLYAYIKATTLILINIRVTELRVQILITEAVSAKVEALAEVESSGELSRKGFPKPIPVLQVVGIKEDTSYLAESSR